MKIFRILFLYMIQSVVYDIGFRFDECFDFLSESYLNYLCFYTFGCFSLNSINFKDLMFAIRSHVSSILCLLYTQHPTTKPAI